MADSSYRTAGNWNKSTVDEHACTVLSETKTQGRATILVITLSALPQVITDCVLQRRVLNSVGTIYPHDALSNIYLLKVKETGIGKYRLNTGDGRDFNPHEWSMKACVRYNSAQSQTDRTDVVIYECVLDLTQKFISGFNTAYHSIARQPTITRYASFDNLVLRLEPLSCKKVRLIWSYTSSRDYNYFMTPKQPSPSGNGFATGFLIHVIEKCVGGKEWLVTSGLGGSGIGDRGRGCADLVLPVDLMPGSEYIIRTSYVYGIEAQSHQSYKTIHMTGANIASYRAEHTMEELHRLLYKARFIRNPFTAPAEFLPCRWLYRHKPPQYFENIFYNEGGMMHPYRKDLNGDPASCINGTLNVLYFAADVDFKTLGACEFPVFGKTRLSLLIYPILLRSKLYFADVYCTKSTHYVTLVLTTAGTEVDQFCVNKLVQLNIYDQGSNPFLFIHQDTVYVTTRLHVEVLVTGSVDVGWHMQRRMGVLESIQTGSHLDHRRKHDGLPKNSQCQQCNLFS